MAENTSPQNLYRPLNATDYVPLKNLRRLIIMEVRKGIRSLFEHDLIRLRKQFEKSLLVCKPCQQAQGEEDIKNINLAIHSIMEMQLRIGAKSRRGATFPASVIMPLVEDSDDLLHMIKMQYHANYNRRYKKGLLTHKEVSVWNIPKKQTA